MELNSVLCRERKSWFDNCIFYIFTICLQIAGCVVIWKHRSMSRNLKLWKLWKSKLWAVSIKYHHRYSIFERVTLWELRYGQDILFNNYFSRNTKILCSYQITSMYLLIDWPIFKNMFFILSFVFLQRAHRSSHVSWEYNPPIKQSWFRWIPLEMDLLVNLRSFGQKYNFFDFYLSNLTASQDLGISFSIILKVYDFWDNRCQII